MGKHAAPGYGRISREFGRFAGIIVLVAAAFFGSIWLLVTFGPGWIDAIGGGGDTTEPATVATGVADSVPSFVDSTSDSTSPPESVPTVITTLPPVPSTTTTTTSVPPERAAGDIVVMVRNSTSRSGLAATATSNLVDLGYQTIEPDNSSPALSVTQILFTEGYAVEAYTVAAQFPDGAVSDAPSADLPADIVVILGSSYVP